MAALQRMKGGEWGIGSGESGRGNRQVPIRLVWRFAPFPVADQGGSRRLSSFAVAIRLRGPCLADSRFPLPDSRRAQARPWMRRVVHLGQVLEIQVGVDLGGGNVGVAEQLLYRAQVAGGFQHVAGEGVPEQVGMDVPGEALPQRQRRSEEHTSELQSPLNLV